MYTVIQKVFIRNVSLRFYAKSKFCVCFESHIPAPDDSKKLCRMSQHCTSSQTENACIATSEGIKSQHNVTTMRNETHVARQKVLTEREFYHVAQHCLNICDLIFSAYDKFLACDVTSLIYCCLDP